MRTEFKEAAPAVPYADEQGLDAEAQLVFDETKAMLGVVPNAARTYMHRPDIAKVIHLFYSTIVLSDRSNLDARLKNKLGVICSSANGCVYCTSHQCSLTQKNLDRSEWGLTDGELLGLISGADTGDTDIGRVCFEFARTASRDPGEVSDALLARMNALMTPAQIVELGCVVAMWKFFNTMHDSLHIPSEGALSKYHGFIEAGRATR